MTHPLDGLNTADAISAFINNVFGHEESGGTNPNTNEDPPEPDRRHEQDELEVPRINPFLQPAKSNTEGYGDRWSDERFVQAAKDGRECDVDNRNEVGEGAEQWLTAEDTHFAVGLYSAHLDGDWKTQQRQTRSVDQAPAGFLCERLEPRLDHEQDHSAHQLRNM
jgi:hypothetical protein